MAADLSFLRPADRRVVALAFAAFVLVSAGFGASALLRTAGPPAPAPSPPAVQTGITKDDITGVRTELRAIQTESNSRFEALDRRLSHLEGYVEASR